MLVPVWENWNPPTLLTGMSNGADTLEIQLGIPGKLNIVSV